MIVLIFAAIAIIVALFVGMVIFLKKFFDREATLHTAHLDTLIAENTAKEEEIKKHLEDAKRQSQEIISNAQKDAVMQKEEILKAVADEKNKIIADAQARAEEVIKQADNARLALLNELEAKISESATLRAQELLQSVLPEDFRKEVHQRWVSDVISSNFAELDRLRVPQGLSEVKVVSAFILTDAQKSGLKLKLKEKLGFEFELKEEIDPSLICGLVVNIGSLILDGSLKFKMQGVARV
jgi:F0F1-type ATP synthase membrane subunit b/b'